MSYVYEKIRLNTNVNCNLVLYIVFHFEPVDLAVKYNNHVNVASHLDNKSQK